jgi:hypothetical protein
MDPRTRIYWDYCDLALSQLILNNRDEVKKNYQKAIGEPLELFR